LPCCRSCLCSAPAGADHRRRDRVQRPARTRHEIGGVFIRYAGAQPLDAGPGDHRRIVGAQFERRRDEGEASLGALLLQRRLDGAVGGDAAGNDQRGRGLVRKFQAKAGQRKGPGPELELVLADGSVYPAKGKITVVCIDPATQRPRLLPDRLAEALKQLKL